LRSCVVPLHSLRISSVWIRGFSMFKLALLAVVAALFAIAPLQASGAGAGAGAGATEKAQKATPKKVVKKKPKRKAVKAKRTKRKEVASASGNGPRMVRRVRT